MIEDIIGYSGLTVAVVFLFLLPDTWPIQRSSPDGSNGWFGWMSPFLVFWTWHALLDGTPLCRCKHSKAYRRSLT